MKLIETTISETAVHIRFSGEGDLPAEWIDIQIPLAKLESSTAANRTLGDPRLQYVEEVQRAILRYARGVITDEIDALVSLSSRQRR